MPPYRHTRMKQYDDIPEGFAGLGPVHKMNVIEG